MQTLRQAISEKYDLLTLQEALKRVGWEAENSIEAESTGEITCNCGGIVKCAGWVGVEHAYCPECGAGIQDATGLLPGGRNTATHIDFDNTEVPEDGAIWIPQNVWGLGDGSEE